MIIVIQILLKHYYMYIVHLHVPYSWKFLMDNIFALEMFADLIFAKQRIFMCALNRRINFCEFNFANLSMSKN